MFDSGMHCVTGLLLASAVLLGLARRLSSGSSGDSRPGSPGRASEPVESKAGMAALLLLSLLLVVSVGSIIGVITWEALKGIAATLTASPEIFVAAIVGAAASAIGFALFALALSFFGPILFVVYEEWTEYVAPVIGGVAGAAISGGLLIIYLVPLGALTGAITLLFYKMLTAKRKITRKSMTELTLAGAGFGVVNGVIVAIFFKVLEMTVELDWLLAG